MIYKDKKLFKIMTGEFTGVAESKGAIKKILIAIDKSGYRQKVIETGTMLAKALGANLTAIHVIDRASLGVVWDLLSYYPGTRAEMYESAVQKESAKLLDEAKNLAQLKGVQMNADLITNASSAAEGILNYAKEADVDLIIVGTKGMTGIEKFLMGNVASKVVSHAHCPVLAIR
jgi:nucleotide-binding universal stress UspA family protein